MGKYNYKEVYEFFKLYAFVLITQEYIDVKQKLTFKDYDGFKGNIKRNRLFKRFYKTNPYTVQNIKLWLKLNNKPFELVSIFYEDANKNLQWKCLKEECGETFEMTWGNLSFGQNCPYCAGVKVGLSNCLATLNPELAKEWHPTKNGDLTPYDITLGSNKEVWWQCLINIKHENHSTISKRIRSKGCSYCNKTKISEDYNLTIDNVDICEYWNYDKNIKPPEQYAPTSNEEVWWFCKDCGNDWKEMIYNVNKRENICLHCNKNKNEKLDGNFVIGEFISNGFIPLFNELDYERNNKSLPCLCIHHKDKGVQNIAYSHIQQGGGCKFCFYDTIGDLKRKDATIVIKDFVDKGYIPLFAPEEYKNNSMPLPYICELHKDKGIQHTAYGNLSSRCGGCKYCGIEKSSGENSHLWRGGITSENKKARNNIEYKDWRRQVFERDNYTCQVCGVRGGSLHAHHINNFSDNPELRLDLNNGVTICKDHHSPYVFASFHNLYGKNNNTYEQLKEYIKRYQLGELIK